MTEEIRQKGKTILSSDDGCNIPVIFNNLIGRNMKRDEYKIYLRCVAFRDMGFSAGTIDYYQNGSLLKSGVIPSL